MHLSLGHVRRALKRENLPGVARGQPYQVDLRFCERRIHAAEDTASFAIQSLRPCRKPNGLRIRRARCGTRTWSYPEGILQQTALNAQYHAFAAVMPFVYEATRGDLVRRRPDPGLLAQTPRSNYHVVDVVFPPPASTSGCRLSSKLTCQSSPRSAAARRCQRRSRKERFPLPPGPDCHRPVPGVLGGPWSERRR